MGIVLSRPLGDQDELGVVSAVDHATRDFPEPNLGAAKILQHGDLVLGLRGDSTDLLEHRRMPIVRSVREVEPENVDPGFNQLPHDDRIRRRGSDGRHNFRADLSKLLFMEGSHSARGSRLMGECLPSRIAEGESRGEGLARGRHGGRMS